MNDRGKEMKDSSTVEGTQSNDSSHKVLMKKTKKRGFSLRFRLLLSIVGISIFFWVISLSIMLFVVWEETGELFDDTLVKTGKMLIHAASGNHIDFRGIKKDSRENPKADDIHYQIIYRGEVISHSKGAPSQPFVESHGDRKRFENVEINGKQWRVYINGAKQQPMEVQVAHGLEMRFEIFEEFAEDLVIPGLILMLLLLIVSSLIIYFLLKPLTNLKEQLNDRSPKELSPIAIESNANELQAIEVSLNHLLERLYNTLENERRFTADAAHELRTPLAALSMQIQLLGRQYPEFSESLNKLRNNVDRSTNLVAHLLLLARLDPMDHLIDSQLSTDWILLDHLFSELKERNQKRADEAQIHLVLEANGAKILGNQELIDVMLQNLIRNALIYCPPNSTLTLNAKQSIDETIIEVKDNGEGVSDEALERLTDRFYRVLGTEQSGSGLGLSIVKRIIDLHEATLTIESGSQYQGLRYKIIF